MNRSSEFSSVTYTGHDERSYLNTHARRQRRNDGVRFLHTEIAAQLETDGQVLEFDGRVDENLVALQRNDRAVRPPDVFNVLQ